MSNITEKSTQEIVWMIVNNLDFEKNEICSVETLTGIKFITWTQVIFVENSKTGRFLFFLAHILAHGVFTYLLPEVGIHP
jgi:hypothetical protein